jgi:hypothetical protein
MDLITLDEVIMVVLLLVRLLMHVIIFHCGSTAKLGLKPPHFGGFIDHPQPDTHTFGGTPLDKRSANFRGHYLHITQQT